MHLKEAICKNNCKIEDYNINVLAESEHFSCGIGDLDDFFQKDVLAFSRRMVSRSYVFCPKEHHRKMACAFSVSYDCLRITDLSNRKQEVPFVYFITSIY